jgi:predicted 2-oxoglutarate/Fe(II)-dependent dioxygenase YbiX
MIIEVDDYLSSDIVEYLKQNIRPFVSTHGQPNSYNRSGSTVEISKVDELLPVHNELQKIYQNIKLYVREFYKPSYSGMSDTGYEYHIYNPGDICKMHSDSELIAGVDELRYASVVLHLNTVDDGGELVFPAQDKTVKTRAGKLVIFPPYGMFSHYTTPSSQQREVIVSWLTYDGVHVGKKGINITSNQGQ